MQMLHFYERMKKLKNIIRWALGLDKKVELMLDNCPPGFDFTDAGRIPVEEIETSLKVMKKINKIGEYRT